MAASRLAVAWRAGIMTSCWKSLPASRQPDQRRNATAPWHPTKRHRNPSGVRPGICCRRFQRLQGLAAHGGTGGCWHRAVSAHAAAPLRVGSKRLPGAVQTNFLAARRLRANSRSRANRANCGAKSSYSASPDIIIRMAVNAYVLGSCCVYRLINSVPIIAT